MTAIDLVLQRLPGKPQVLRSDGLKTPSVLRARQIATVPTSRNRNTRRMPKLYDVGSDRVGLQCGTIAVHADELIGHHVLSQVIAPKVRRCAGSQLGGSANRPFRKNYRAGLGEDVRQVIEAALVQAGRIFRQKIDDLGTVQESIRRDAHGEHLSLVHNRY